MTSPELNHPRHPLPPESLYDLRELVAFMGANRGQYKLGAKSYAALVKLVNQPKTAAFSSINQLAEQVGVNASTLTRLATRLGYKGFNDLQHVFRQHMATENHFYSSRVEQLISTSPNNSQAGSLELINQVAGDEAVNIKTMINQLDPASIDKTIHLLSRARSVRTYAQRQFYGLAAFFSYCMGLIREDVSVLGESGHGVPHALAQLNHQDVIIVFGSEPYTRIAVETCRTASANQIPTVVFVDSFGAPLASSAHAVFAIPTAGHFYSNSTAAWVILLEGLLSILARYYGKKALNALSHREQLFHEMGVTYSEHKDR